MNNMQQLEKMAIENGVDLKTLRRFIAQVAGDLKKQAMAPTTNDVEIAIGNRQARNMQIIDDCVTHPAEAAALVFSKI